MNPFIEGLKKLKIIRDENVNKYRHMSVSEHTLEVLGTYFNQVDAVVPEETLEEELVIIKELFPDYTDDCIMNLLHIIGDESNRIRVVIRLLFNHQRKTGEQLGGDGDESVVPFKKLKIDVERDATDEIKSPATCSLESVTTILYTPDDIMSEEVVETAAAPVETAAAPAENNYDYSKPSTSGLNYCNGYKLTKSSTEVTPKREKLNSSTDSVEPEIETRSKKKEYNLYKHLHEMFTDLPYEIVRHVCKLFHAKKHTPPPDDVMNRIISRLLYEKSLNSDSDDSAEVSMKVDVTVQPLAVPKVGFKLEELMNTMNKPIEVEDQETLEDVEMVEQLPSEDNNASENKTLIRSLMEMFPEACPKYIKKICKDKKNSYGVLDELISEILDSDYPKRVKSNSPPRALNADEQLELLKNVLVDADPDYLQMSCDLLLEKPELLKDFIEKSLETRDYPTMKDFLRKQKLSAQQKQYTTEFSIEHFLEVIPKPFEYFKDPERKMNALDYQSYHYAMYYLRNKFNMLTVRMIKDCFTRQQQNFLATCSTLDQISSSLWMKSRRPKSSMPEVISNIPLLQEIAFFEHQDEISKFLKERELQDEIDRAQTKAAGLMATCSCCFDDEVMPKDVYTCEAGCVFCKSCVQKGIEIAFGDGKLDYPCLANCSAYFTLQVLQAVLTPKTFSAIAIKKQVQEVKAAGIEDLETCPFCDFATIPARDDKLFRCLNPECMKESCRNCKEPSHVPLRCEEVEKDQDVKARTYIENKMTEALLRTCYKCEKKFIKEDGCNKMTCTCGALMCYVCGLPVQDYKHFNGLGGDKHHLCPLYSDTNQLHRDAVIKGATEAKNEMGLTSADLKNDPSADIQNYYKSTPMNTVHRLVPVVRQFEEIRPVQILLPRGGHIVVRRHTVRGRRQTRGGRGMHHHNHD